MNGRVFRLLYLHELRMLVRAGRAVVLAIVLPAVIMPIMLVAGRYSTATQERTAAETTYRYAVTGSMAAEFRGTIARARTALELDTSNEFQNLRDVKMTETTASDPKQSLEKGEIHFFLSTFTAAEADQLSGAKDGTGAGPAPSVRGAPLIQVTHFGNVEVSRNGAFFMDALLAFARRNEARTLLVDSGFEGDPRHWFTVDATSVATASETAGSLVGRFLTVVLVMLMLSGGSVAAMDIVAGERERGTLETLLTTAAGRPEIVAAKLLAIATTALVSVLIQGLNFFVYVKLGVIPLPVRFALDLSIAGALALLILFVPLAAAIGAALLLISSRARTYKEAQMYFLPVFLLSMIPSLAAALPGLRLRSAIAVVPLANISVAVREILTSRFDVPMIAVTFAAMTLTAALLMRASARLLDGEGMAAGTLSDSGGTPAGPTLFENRVLIWFAVMWALVFAVAANVPALATFRRQLLFNEIVIFAGAGAAMIGRYRLNVRETLSLRSVPWPVWVAMAIAAPSANAMSAGLFRILNTVFPISEELAKQMEALVPRDLPAWQLYLFVAVIPGVVEELAFRGILLHGLRRRVRPLYLPLVVGIIFGFFHFTLFRIGPTAFLGVLLTWIAMRTGSVFPGMILHVLNNAFAVWAAQREWPLGALDWQHYFGATVIFGLAMWIVWRACRGEAGSNRYS